MVKDRFWRCFKAFGIVFISVFLKKIKIIFKNKKLFIFLNYFNMLIFKINLKNKLNYFNKFSKKYTIRKTIVLDRYGLSLA
jgi:hypothetical protein